MDIRLIGLDLDRTVFDSQKRISPRTRSAIAAACARGVAVLPATGRPRAGLPDAFVQIPGVRYAITSNGGAVYDLAGGRCMAVDPLPKEDALWALVRGRELGGLIDVYVEGGPTRAPLPLRRWWRRPRRPCARTFPPRAPWWRTRSAGWKPRPGPWKN